MITNNLPLNVSDVPQQHYVKSATRFQPLRLSISNFIANILSRAFLSAFTGFYSPLRNPSMQQHE